MVSSQENLCLHLKDFCVIVLGYWFESERSVRNDTHWRQEVKIGARKSGAASCVRLQCQREWHKSLTCEMWLWTYPRDSWLMTRPMLLCLLLNMFPVKRAIPWSPETNGYWLSLFLFWNEISHTSPTVESIHKNNVIRNSVLIM